MSVDDLEVYLKEMLTARGILDHAPSITKYSLLSTGRLKYMISALSAARIGGETAEIGCHRGGTSRLIALLNHGARHWACDTFRGLVDAAAEDEHLKDGDFAAEGLDVGAVRTRLRDLTNVNVIEGYFPDCAPPEMKAARYSFAHLDTDTYRSMLAGYEFFAPRMVDGGMLALDDVIGRGTPGAIRAWGEIRERGGAWTIFNADDRQVILRFDWERKSA